VKYRVVKEYGLFYPQMRRFFIWASIHDVATGYHTIEEARDEIEGHKKIFSKIHKVDVVRRSW
jgi:hypothetical protein